jgi:transcriptional regulator with XRE-family HTH domain
MVSMLDSGDPGPGELVSVVAANVKRLREKAGLTLSELASRASIGKSTLSMVESAKANPSIETLWAIAAALGVPVGQIIEPRAPEVRVVRAGEGIPIHAEKAEVLARLLVSSHRRSSMELYLLEAEPGAVHQAMPHIKGAIEHIYVISGRLRVGPESAPVEIAAGDLATFAGDQPHLYEALAPATQVIMLMEYS